MMVRRSSPQARLIEQRRVAKRLDDEGIDWLGIVLFAAVASGLLFVACP